MLQTMVVNSGTSSISSPYIDRGNFVYVQTFNSPMVNVIFNTYVTMSYYPVYF